MSSAPSPIPSTNPYIVMLNEAIDDVPGVRLEFFSWRRAVLGPFDVLHVHWPETLVTGRSRGKRIARQLLFCVMLLRMWWLRIPLVRTVHNLEFPRDISTFERWLLRLTERRTTLRIRVNAHTEIASGPVETIVHGHYQDWFAAYPTVPTVPGRITFFGAIRRYKGAQGLVEAFRDTHDETLTLRVAGRPSTDALADELKAAAGDDPRIGLSFAFLSDAELVREVSEAELVVLPYPEMHNSGGVLAALSLDRPVLVADNEVNRELAAEVGPGWLLSYEAPLRARHLSDALAELRRVGERGRPDLSARGWTEVGELHVAAFRRAVELLAG